MFFFKRRKKKNNTKQQSTYKEGLPASVESLTTKTMFCQNCGNVIMLDKLKPEYCGFCLTKIYWIDDSEPCEIEKFINEKIR